MKFRTTKNPVFCPMGLRRAMPTALAIVATLALVSSAHAQTYTWTGSGTSNNWFTTGLNSANFSSSPLVSSTATTDLLFEGTTRPSTVLNSSLNTRSITFNTGADFSITPVANEVLNIGAGGIANLVARTQTIGSSVSFRRPGGIVPVNVAADGVVILGRQGSSTSFTLTQALEKTGSGTLTFRGNGTGLLKITEGTVNINTDTAQPQFSASIQLNGGELNVPVGKTVGFYTASSQTGGVFNLDGQFEGDSFSMSGGILKVGDEAGFQRGPVTFSGSSSTIYTGTVGGGMFIGGDALESTVLLISAGSHDFGAATVVGDPNVTPGQPSVLVTGGTAGGFYKQSGLTNDGGSITFTAKPGGFIAENNSADLTFTSGTVSIATAGGGTIGALVNSVNTTLGAGNTLKLDLNEDLTRDLLITSGTLNWGGNVALNLTNFGEVANGSTWDFFNDPDNGYSTGAFAGTLDGISLSASSIYNGLSFTKSGSLWTSTSTGGGQQFTFNETTGVLAVVPEPSSIAVVGMGLAMLGWRRLARRQRAAA